MLAAFNFIIFLNIWAMNLNYEFIQKLNMSPNLVHNVKKFKMDVYPDLR